MTDIRASESPVLERAERLVEQIEDEAARLASSLLARAVELAEDVWAEAQAARKGPSEL